MKNLQIFVLFLIGGILTALGVLFKMLLYSFASFFLIVGMTFNGVALLLIIYKLIKKNDSDTFLDS
jgi:uncharacterized membrane protein